MQNVRLTEESKVPIKKAFLMYLIASMFLFFEMAVQVSPSVMTTQLMHDLQMGVVGLGFMSGCYFYSYTAMQIPSGALLDRFNPRLVIVISIMTCVLGCLFLGMSTDLVLACFARMLMGFGSAFAFVSVLVVTADLFPSKYFATMTGITQMLAAFGAMSGQLPVHMLVSSLGWRHTMFTCAILGFLIAILVYNFLRYEKSVSHHEVRENVKVNFRAVIGSTQTWYIAIYACLLWAPMSAFTSLWGVPFLINVDHLSAGTAAFFCSLMWLGLAVASPCLGYLSTHFNNRKAGLVYSSCLGIISFALILFFHVGAPVLILLLFLAGAACSGQALSFTLVKENNSSEVVATAIAFNNMAVVISGALFQPLIGWLLSAISGNEIFKYHVAISIVLVAYLLGFLVAYFCIKEPKEVNALITPSSLFSRNVLQIS